MANVITIIRIICSFALLFFPALSVPFYMLYITAGFTDMIDGTVARKTGTVSDFGSKLDTVADFILVAVSLIKLIPILDIESWIFIWIGIILIIKMINIISGFVVQKRFVSVHSVMNKITGGLLFALPLTVRVIDLRYSAAIVCAIATFAAIQEGHHIRTFKEKSIVKEETRSMQDPLSVKRLNETEIASTHGTFWGEALVGIIAARHGAGGQWPEIYADGASVMKKEETTMGLFGLGRKKQPELTAEERRQNALWERWANGKAPSPLAEIMTYQSEVNNGGHDQYFFNVSNTGDLRNALAVLEEALPEVHTRNLKRAYDAYSASEEQDDTEQAEAILEQCDAAFYEHEEEITSLLKAYAAQVEL